VPGYPPSAAILDPAFALRLEHLRAIECASAGLLNMSVEAASDAKFSPPAQR
jgi:hypothetical protein